MKISLSISPQMNPPVHLPFVNNTHTPNIFHIPTTVNSLVLGKASSKEKVVVVMGATGAGKSRLSIDLATSFAAEIINSDKMQVYEGLDIATNKITPDERRGVPHHLLGIIDPESDFSPGNFRALASVSLKSIVERDQLPIIVGGSNSFIEALVDLHFQSKYECCFLWVDVAMSVLDSFVSKRVDKMVERGLLEEVRDFYEPNMEYSKGVRRAIGVPELDPYFRGEPFGDQETETRVLNEAIEAIKSNTSRLARRQLEKINRLKKVKGWRMHRVDATSVFRKEGVEAWVEWENEVRSTSEKIVSKFLYDSPLHRKATSLMTSNLKPLV